MQRNLSVPPLLDRPARLLVVVPCEERRALLSAAFASEGHDVAELVRPELFCDAVSAEPPDLVVVDASDPDGSVLEILGDLRTLDPVHLVPLVVLAPLDASEDEVARALLGGADDVITDARRLRELSARISIQLRNRRDRDLLRSTQKERSVLADEALTDPLTGLGNRRAADRALVASGPDLESLLLLVVDVDHFKRVNDTWGHAVGDEVLRTLGRCLRRLGRDHDDVARFGGEEFLVIIRNAPPKSHRVIAERFLRGVRAMALPPGLGPTRVTASIGAITWEHPDPRPAAAELFATADRALYAAKRGGRDALVLVRANAPEPPLAVVTSDSIA